MADAKKKKTETEETPEAVVEETEAVVEETTPEAPAAEAEPVVEEPIVEEPVAEETAPEPEAAVEEPAAAAEEAPAAEAAPAAAAEEAAPVEAAVSKPKRPRKRLPRSLRHKHSKPARETGGKRKAIVRLPKPEPVPGRRQERRGIVVSDKGEKTIVVKVEMIRAHPKYKKVVRRNHKFHAHDEQNSAGIGDVVRIIETRPLSKTKNWRLAEIVEKAK
jgi:small subunit ribosomal protein S17